LVEMRMDFHSMSWSCVLFWRGVVCTVSDDTLQYAHIHYTWLFECIRLHARVRLSAGAPGMYRRQVWRGFTFVVRCGRGFTFVVRCGRGRGRRWAWLPVAAWSHGGSYINCKYGTSKHLLFQFFVY
jgi:hypothetical protein